MSEAETQEELLVCTEVEKSPRAGPRPDGFMMVP